MLALELKFWQDQVHAPALTWRRGGQPDLGNGVGSLWRWFIDGDFKQKGSCEKRKEGRQEKEDSGREGGGGVPEGERKEWWEGLGELTERLRRERERKQRPGRNLLQLEQRQSTLRQFLLQVQSVTTQARARIDVHCAARRVIQPANAIKILEGHLLQ